MAVIISNTSLNSPPLLSPSFRALTHNNHNTRWSYHNLNVYTRLFTIKASSKAKDGDYEGIEESRWLREEQRWLREEQRWIREESRWNSERNSLLLQIQRLQSELDRIQARNNSSMNFDVDYVVDDDNSFASRTLIKMAEMLKGLKNGENSDSKRIAEVLDNEVVSEVVVPPVIPPVSRSDVKEEKKEKEKEKEKPKTKTSSSLRMGAEGDEVRILQEALMSLGFYSGEEDMEFSSFSDGTARAVKTWQASIGIREDGVMTAELLERLYGSQELQSSESSLEAEIRKIDKANGAITEVREVRETVVKKEPTDVYVSEHRVFLLGENRWEEPSRLNKTKGNTPISAGKCLTCKGEGQLLCMECDGTGEPNVEEQFLDWVEEGANCPYCEGRGYNVCDVCHGKLVL